MSQTSSEKLWGGHDLPETGALRFQFGPLTFWVRRAEQDFVLYVKRDPAEEIRCSVDRADPPADLKASDRFAYEGAFEALRAVPVMPERSLVVRPENPLKILSGQKTLFFVSIPLAIRIQLLHGEKALTMTELPTVVLSNTLFGDPMGGELCFALKTSAKHNLATVTKRRWRAICPISVINLSEKNLDLQRLCVQSRHLGCFQGAEFLWTHPIEVVHRSEKEEIDVRFGEEPPAFEPIAGRLSEPREVVRKSLLKRGLGSLRLINFI